jgi:hypothetical protein
VVGLGRVLGALFLLAARAALAQDPRAAYPGRAVELPASEIRESFLRYLGGVINADLPADLAQADLRELFPEFRRNPASAFNDLARVARLVDRADGRARLLFGFSEDLHVGVPFLFPWYTPVSFEASRTVVLVETRAGSRALGPDPASTLSPLFAYRVESGRGSVHFDDWIIALSGGFLDDFDARGAALFVFRGAWHGLICGVTPRGRLVSWLYDLKRMRPVIPLPRELMPFAAELAGK